MKKIFKFALAKKDCIKLFLFSVFIGFLFSLSFVVRYGTSFSILKMLIAFAVTFILSFLLIQLKSDDESKENNNRNYTLLFFVIILISYTLCLLTFFPGVGMNDSLNILRVGMSISIQFPFCYVLFIRILKAIGELFGSLQLSIALYSIIQVITVSYVSARLLSWLWKRKINIYLKTFSLIFFIFNPVLCMYSISMVKDTLFSLLLTVLFVLIYEIENDDIRKDYWILLLLSSLGVCLLRNNGPMIVFIVLIILAIEHKEYYKNIIIVLLVTILFVSTATMLTNRYHSGQLFREAVGIPIQQIAATVCDENGIINEEDKEFISNIISIDNIKKQYNPYNVDDIKFHNFDADFLQDHKTEFIKVWFRILKDNFPIYVKSYLKATYYFWAPVQDNRNNICLRICVTAGSSSLENFIIENKISDDPVIKGKIGVFLQNYYRKSEFYFSEGLSFWLLMTCMTVSTSKNKNRKYLLAYMPMILLWLTIMIATPVSGSLRYVLAFVYCLPFSICLMFDRG